MPQTILEFIAAQPVVDVHEHHMPEGLLNKDVGLLTLLTQSYAGWARRSFENVSEDDPPRRSTLSRTGEGGWPELRGFVDASGSNAFIRNMVRALAELYNLGDEGITEGNWQNLDREIRRRHASDTWIEEVLDRANIAHIITDPYLDPLMDARRVLGPRYSSVLRINALAMGWHPESRDHNGNSAHDFAQRMGFTVAGFDNYMSLLERLVETMPDRHQVALKSALAYDRALNFDDADEKLARSAWGKSNPTQEERKAFGDFVVDRLCELAGRHGLPVQMHVGLGRIRGSHPMNTAGLIERHPNTRFLLMHLAYPWSADLLGLAFSYHNTWLDLTWAPTISPSHFKRVLHEAIEVLPDESRMMIGGDNWHAEETFGSLNLARRLIGEVLHEKVGAGYFSEADARRVSRRILHENATAFFRLDVP